LSVVRSIKSFKAIYKRGEKEQKRPKRRFLGVLGIFRGLREVPPKKA